MYDPCIPEALKMYEIMTSKHVREILQSKLIWIEVKDEYGIIEQLVPTLDITFKF